MVQKNIRSGLSCLLCAGLDRMYPVFRIIAEERMKLIEFMVLVLAIAQLSADVVVLNNGEKVECEILTVRNDTLIAIYIATGELHRFAFDDITRVEKTQVIIKRDKSVEYGFFGGIIGALVALSLQELADLEDTKITTPLYTICVSSGIIMGVQTGKPKW
jgi:hypothetical protein